MSSISWRRRQMLSLLISAAAWGSLAGRLLGVLLPRGWGPERHAARKRWSPGISVLIPERDHPEVLQACLESLAAAMARLAEPVEILVVASGCGPEKYESLRNLVPAARWVFYPKPLRFHAAVRRGLRRARYDWVYLLNSDMQLEADSLAALLPWRSGSVFSIASQIFFRDSRRRREETGWTEYGFREGRLEIWDAEPEKDGMVRGHLYSGGGASLFQKSLLARVMACPNPYDPFYWEDVEWGVRAWRLGFESLFCPESRVVHGHRCTNRKFFGEEEIDRIFRRNRFLFQLRNEIPGGSEEAVRETVQWQDQKTVRELVTLWRMAGIFFSRLRGRLYPHFPFPLETVRQKYYPWPDERDSSKPRIVLVTPFAIYPPAHGGAVRLHRLIGHLAAAYRVDLLSDEASGYGEESRPYFKACRSIHLVSGRRDSQASEMSRRSRMESHCHPHLRNSLRWLIDAGAPRLVQIEYAELLKLAEIRRRRDPPWVVTMHDVPWPPEKAGWSRQDGREYRLAKRYDRVLVCCQEDAALARLKNVEVVPNGADSIDRESYVSSAGSRDLLFMGPFRYRPNLEGIVRFLESVYPALKGRLPGVRLQILGGRNYQEYAAGRDCFQQEGICLCEWTADTMGYLQRCALTINPLHGIRGSSLKLAESLAAGRVCVSTREGARGFLECGIPGLVVVDRIADFLDPLVRLLSEEADRLRLEQGALRLVSALSWEHGARKQARVYRQLLAPAGKAR